MFNASQSSGHRPASNALDGMWSKLDQCSEFIPNPTTAWWMAELPTYSTIINIRINRRGDCCFHRYGHVTVSTSIDGTKWTLCKDLGDELSKKSWVSAVCPRGTKGNFVKIESQIKEALMLCEVEAYGSSLGKLNVLKTSNILKFPKIASIDP